MLEQLQAKMDQAWAHLVDKFRPGELPLVQSAIVMRERSAKAAGRKIDALTCALAIVAIGEISLHMRRRADLEEKPEEAMRENMNVDVLVDELLIEQLPSGIKAVIDGLLARGVPHGDVRAILQSKIQRDQHRRSADLLGLAIGAYVDASARFAAAQAKQQPEGV